MVRQGAADPLLAVIDAAGTNLGPCGLQRGSVFGSFIHLVDRDTER
jgi:cobyrinic acid a,c-diamide synthase